MESTFPLDFVSLVTCPIDLIPVPDELLEMVDQLLAFAERQIEEALALAMALVA